MIASCMRYCTSRTARCTVAIQADQPFQQADAESLRAASRDRTVGGSWQWSPASTTRSQRSSGTQQPGSVV